MRMESAPNVQNFSEEECFIGDVDGVFTDREVRKLEPRDRWDTEAFDNVIGVPWRMTDGR